jgi:hypothetical protein
LGQANERFHTLPDKQLQDLILQVSGLDKDSKVPKLIFSTLKQLSNFASFEDENGQPEPITAADRSGIPPAIIPTDESIERRVGLNLAYTINLNLPATSDQAVFNAIFKSLKEHLLSNE